MKKPKIAIDIRTNHQTGVYRYSVSLINAFLPLTANEDIDFYLIYYWTLPANLLEKCLEYSNWNLVPINVKRPFNCNEPHLIDLLISNQIDLYYTTNYLLDINITIPYIFTIHDLIRLKYPTYGYSAQEISEKFGPDEIETMRSTIKHLSREKFDEDLFINYFWSVNLFLTANCYQVVTVSNEVQKDIIQYLTIPRSRTVIISGAVDTRVFSTDIKHRVDIRIKQIGNKNYCLYVGLNHKHKRIKDLLLTLKSSLNKIPPNAIFVFVCPHKDHCEQIMAIARSLYLDDHVLCLTRVNDHELSFLYSHAKAYVTASIDEGFGLPIQEALTCGTEVIVPDLPIVRETIANSGHIYPKFDFERLKELLILTYTDRLPRRAGDYRQSTSWQQSAFHLIALFKDFLKGNPHKFERP